RVIAAMAQRPAIASTAASKSVVSKRAVSSASLANRMSTWVSMKPLRAPRWRSTTKASERVSAILRPAARATPAALANACRAACGVAGRAAGGLQAGLHAPVKLSRPRLVDQHHRALDQGLRGQEGVVRRRDHVDDGVADGGDVVAGGHGGAVSEGWAAATYRK